MVGKRPKLKFPVLKRGGKPAPLRRRPVYFGGDKPTTCPIYDRSALPAGAKLAGPALIEEHGTTTVLHKGDSCQVAPSGELIVSVGGAR
jgi:N-methylhydantoinase A